MNNAHVAVLWCSLRPYYVSGEGWYLETREGLLGPCQERAEAERLLEQIKQAGRTRRTIWAKEVRDAYNLVLGSHPLRPKSIMD